MARAFEVHHAKPRILVVEDVADVREMYMEYLSYLGFRVEGGWEAIRILRADPRTKAIPIVVLTGQAQPEPLALAKAVGATEVITKPCLPAQLGDVIVSTLSHATH